MPSLSGSKHDSREQLSTDSIPPLPPPMPPFSELCGNMQPPSPLPPPIPSFDLIPSLPSTPVPSFDSIPSLPSSMQKWEPVQSSTPIPHSEDHVEAKEPSNVTVSSGPPSPSPFWLRSLDLRPTDEFELMNGDWLSDKHINAAGKLLKQQHPNQNGTPSC